MSNDAQAQPLSTLIGILSTGGLTGAAAAASTCNEVFEIPDAIAVHSCWGLLQVLDAKINTIAASEAATETRVRELESLYQEVATERNEAVAAREAAMASHMQTVNTVNSLTAQLARANASSSAASDSIRYKPAEPDTFTGDEKDITKRSALYSNWRQTVFHRCAHLGSNDERIKILHAAFTLSGTARDSIRVEIDKIQHDQAHTSTWRTLEDFLAHLDKMYKTTNDSEMARRKIRDFKQAGDYADFQVWKAHFTNLAAIGDVDPRFQVEYMKDNVSGRLQRAIEGQLSLPKKDNVEGWLEVFATLDENQKDRDAAIERRNPTCKKQASASTTGGPPAKAPTLTTTQGGNAMDISERIDIFKVSPSELQRRIMNNLCKYCGESGHYAFSCPKKTATNARGGPLGQAPRGRGDRGSGPAQQWQPRPQPYRNRLVDAPSPGYVDVPNPGYVEPSDAGSDTATPRPSTQSQTVWSGSLKE
jgi:hypothetical protein